MHSRAEQHKFARYKWWAVAALVLCVGLEVYGAYQLETGLTAHKATWDVFDSIASNLAAALLTLFVVRWFVTEDERTNYVRAMKSLRTSLRPALNEGKISPEAVQTLMKDFVQAISGLYFNDPTPPIAGKQKLRDYAKVRCYSCRSPFEVADGRCKRCGDLPETWIDESETAAES